MKVARVINVVDSHAAGEPARVVVGGLLHIPGATMPEKQRHMEEYEDSLRTALLLEPRGHAQMFGAYLTPPVSAQADFGALFMNAAGYLNMCGHNTIAAVTIALETGMIKKPIEDSGNVTVTIDTSSGLVATTAHMAADSCKVEAVSFDNVPSFLYKSDVRVNVPGIGELTIDIAYAGSFFAQVRAADVGLEIAPENVQALCDLGVVIRDCANARVAVEHPALPHIHEIALVQFCADPREAGGPHINMVVFGHGQFDRSPCGTGTCARMANLHAKGKLHKHEPFTHAGVLGTTFTGQILNETQVGDYKAVIPRVKGSAYITGFNTIIIDPTDPLRNGFTV